MSNAINLLKQYEDKEYAAFQVKLTPGVTIDQVIGVRVPNVRLIAKEYIKDSDHLDFLNELPHKYYDENMLHGLLISANKNYDEVINQLDVFLPYVDNWAVCDIMSPKVLKKDKQRTLEKIKEWTSSDKTYTIRFGLEMLMSFYLDEDYKEEYLDYIVKTESNEYYINMMRAWFVATGLAKQYDSTIKLIESNKLDIWTHNKSIQKAIESYRITDEQKTYLKTLKRK